MNCVKNRCVNYWNIGNVSLAQGIREYLQGWFIGCDIGRLGHSIGILHGGEPQTQ